MADSAAQHADAGDRRPAVRCAAQACSRVAVANTAALPPEPLRLSALDAQWVTLPLIQRLLIFSDSDDVSDNTRPPFASAVDSLRASLSETLAKFPPLAGRIVHQLDSGDAAIDCTAAGVIAAGGVRFIVAEMISEDAARLAGEEEHHAEAFRRLVPELDAGELPAETMAAQVTRLRGGMAIGVAVHHAVADGRSVWRFLEAWAAACRGGAEDDDDDDVEPPPTFDRKHRITDLSPARHVASPPSSFVAIASLAWVSFVHSKYQAGIVSLDDEVYLFFFADCRTRLNPPPHGTSSWRMESA
ncbi:hypothetical protein HU200_055988 [Digitaria exilis]|uniref:Uncharacterized protein n=1 Tax=Digitaria exilis TaxID=1010633 RepID=A0A835AHH5_9POAL|nr:hypothetical protein HU200_055988 [Digitaria exilis]